MTTEDIVEEVEHLARQLEALREAEDLSEIADRKLHRALTRLHQRALARIRLLVRRVLRGRIMLGAASSKVSLEHLERMFIVLKDQAEMAQARAAKFTGKKAKRARSEADLFARYARQAAAVLKASAKRKDRWNDAYIAEIGLQYWIR